MINRSVLVGRLTRDVDLRTTGSGISVGQFTLAVNRQFTNAQGEREADFINCVIWRKSAENLANFTHKGSLIGVEGRIQTRSYDNQEGQRVYVTELVVDNFSLLDPKKDNQNQQTTNYSSGNQGFSNNTTASSKPADPFASNSDIDISDDDLPF